MCKLGLNVNAKVENGCKDDVAYEKFLSSFQNHFDIVLKKVRHKKLFTTNAEGLWEAFINNIDERYRQHYACNCCRHFIKNFGGLVFIDEDGTTIPAMWSSDVPELFQASVEAVIDIVSKATVNGVFVTDKNSLGTAKTGEWSHFHVILPDHMVVKHPLYTSYQMMASHKEDFKCLMDSLMTYSLEHVELAIQVLNSEALTSSEKFIGIVKWLKEVHERRNAEKNSKNKTNIVWLLSATAPFGFCHISSSMVGTLLDDISNGEDFETVKGKFNFKVDPMRYKRSQTDPTEANKQRAEQIFAELGLEKSLERRFARLDEVKTIWKPKQEEKPPLRTEGIFAHVKTKESNVEKRNPSLDIPPIVMTWDKFNRTVLNEAESIEMYVPEMSHFFAGILTATHADANPIIRWDRKDNRNPFSHYLYHLAMSARVWNLKSGWINVTGVCYQPSMWQEGFDHHGKAVFFLLEGCKDRNYIDGDGNGNALFPDILIPELHEVRKTVEAYSANAPLGGYDDASACGIRLQSDNEWNVVIRVTTKGRKQDYTLDRWD